MSAKSTQFNMIAVEFIHIHFTQIFFSNFVAPTVKGFKAAREADKSAHAAIRVFPVDVVKRR